MVEEKTLKKEMEGVPLDIEALEKEINSTDWVLGWEKGRDDTLRAIRDYMLPANERVLKSAEIIYKLMVKNFGNVFSKVFAGFNSAYDEPAILLCVKTGSDVVRARVCLFGAIVANAFNESDLLPLNVLVTREESTDFETVRHDFKFERLSNA